MKKKTEREERRTEENEVLQASKQVTRHRPKKIVQAQKPKTERKAHRQNLVHNTLIQTLFPTIIATKQLTKNKEQLNTLKLINTKGSPKALKHRYISNLFPYLPCKQSTK